MAPTGKTKIVAAGLLTVLTSAQGLLVGLSKNAQGRYDYNTATVPLCAEFLKMCLSMCFLAYETNSNKKVGKGTNVTVGRGMLLYIVPSIIYLIHHNLTFAMLRYLTPSTYQILGNIKIITTGLLSRVMLKRKLSYLRWMALVLLMVGTTTSQLGGQGSKGSSFRTVGSPVTGYLLGLINALLSALAGVYTEFLMKKNQDTLNWQNIQLYGCGVAANALRLTVHDMNVGSHPHGPWFFPSVLLHGYDWRTAMVVINLSVSGLLVSFLMKYADTIAKVFSTSMAMFLTPVASIFLFGLMPSFPLLCGVVTASMALQLYYVIGPRQTVSSDEDLLTAAKALQEAKGLPA
mmetsp:Transcript_57678/g.182653  ORF Transcript_57678/g.182653 Transcript_57678/m.182653 type:complete len:347 (-) Transcript_57678:1264-2304(-)